MLDKKTFYLFSFNTIFYFKCTKTHLMFTRSQILMFWVKDGAEKAEKIMIDLGYVTTPCHILMPRIEPNLL